MLVPIFLLATIPAAQVDDAPVVTCRPVAPGPSRTWRLQRSGPRWHLAHWAGDARDVVQLALPESATVRATAERLDVTGRTSNGGIAVTLAGAPAQATLDVYVSYELEVNVDTSLTPRIDQLNTDGPLPVRCDVA